jgi:hypothetical protein
MALKLLKFRHPLEKKGKEGFKGYPVGTVAYYGPDNTAATKVVVAVIMVKDAEPSLMKKWFSEDGKEIRRNRGILDEIRAFFRENGVRSVVLPTKILGCPHQEGIDYPEGESCPQCPFWKNRDRFTDEMIH